MELQQQSQQHQFQLISCLGLSGALSQPGTHPNKSFGSHSPPSCMLAGRDSPSPISSCLSENDERMSYLSGLSAQDRLVESTMPLDVFGSTAPNNTDELRSETNQEVNDNSEYSFILTEKTGVYVHILERLQHTVLLFHQYLNTYMDKVESN